jgi:hypothetical protein
MKPEPFSALHHFTERVGAHLDVEPAVPVAVGPDAAGETPARLVLGEGHPVDATPTR